MRGARETALASSTYAPFTWSLPTFTRWNWKCHVIIVIKTDLSGFVVPMHSGLCEQYVKSLGLRPRDLTSCFARALVHWDNNPSRTGLNPLNISNRSLWQSSWNNFVRAQESMKFSYAFDLLWSQMKLWSLFSLGSPIHYIRQASQNKSWAPDISS